MARFSMGDHVRLRVSKRFADLPEPIPADAEGVIAGVKPLGNDVWYDVKFKKYSPPTREIEEGDLT